MVGAVAGTALILLGVILFLRRKKLAAQVGSKQADGQDHGSYMTGFKPELHSEPAQLPRPVYEMDASQLRSPSELAVHEKPQELSADQGSKRTGGESSR